MNFIQADETGRRQLPADPMPRPGGDESGPSKPGVKTSRLQKHPRPHETR